MPYVIINDINYIHFSFSEYWIKSTLLYLLKTAFDNYLVNNRSDKTRWKGCRNLITYAAFALESTNLYVSIKPFQPGNLLVRMVKH